MPLNNRYVVAAIDTLGEQIAFLSPSHEWVESVREAACFPSQHDANYFIEQNDLRDHSDSKTLELNNFDHVQPVFVTVKNKEIIFSEQNPNDPEDSINFSGIFG